LFDDLPSGNGGRFSWDIATLMNTGLGAPCQRVTIGCRTLSWLLVSFVRKFLKLGGGGPFSDFTASNPAF
jgi:hypothetical protein